MNTLLTLLLLFLTYTQISYAQYSPARRPFSTVTCCTVTEGLKLVNEEYQCNDRYRSSEECCQQAIAPRFDRSTKRLVKATADSCANVDLSIYNSSVEVCTGPTTFRVVVPVVGHGIDAATSLLQARHAWIRTPYVEAGQGSMSRNIVMTEWQDHTGDGDLPRSICRQVVGCNERCVEDAMALGEPLGLYGPGNTCHDVVVRTLSRCGCYDSCVRYNMWGYCAEWNWPPLGRRTGLRSR